MALTSVAPPTELAVSSGAVSAGALAVVALLAAAFLLVALRRSAADRRQLAATSAQLARGKQELMAITESLPTGVFRVDPNGQIRFANTQLDQILGGSAYTSCSTAPIHPDDLQSVHDDWSGALQGGRPFVSQFRINRSDGEVRWVDVECHSLTDPDGQPLGWVGSISDSTDSIATVAHLKRLSEIVEATPDQVTMINTDGRITHANAAMRSRFGLPEDVELTEIDAVDLYAPHERQRFLTEAIRVAERDGEWTGEVDLMLRDGTTIPVSQVIVAHRNADGALSFYSSITRDLSEKRRFEAQLARAEFYDPVTALPNRAYFINAVEVALERGLRSQTQLAVLLADVDHFKLVNDSLGHAAGDDMLRAVAERLRVAVGPSALLARFGSDEFCLLVEDVSDEQAPMRLAEQIGNQLSAPIDMNGDTIFVTVSTGIAMSTANSTTQTPEGLLRDAHTALHQAKDRGRARSEVFTDDFRQPAVNQLRTASDLHRALAGEEFRVVYQPEVDLRSGHIVGVEALVRWHHPERGLVPPAEFIPLAEQTGLITGIGAWVLDTAVAQAAEWSRSRWNGTSLQVWVNLSARQLGDSGLVDKVSTSLSRHSVAPQSLGLEITESALLEDAEGAVATLSALRALGVRLAIDDFGTGHSSLSYLKRLPVDAVKIDRSFISGLVTEGDDSAIVAAVTGMAKALRLTTIAEGVETIGQLFALRRLGCDLAQGYFFSTPQPPDHITRLLTGDRGAGLFTYEETPSTSPATAISPTSPRPRA
jgi:diguanylate cyclase (GGDEF)-like protein/PAS domain S-box-containing protein